MLLAAVTWKTKGKKNNCNGNVLVMHYLPWFTENHAIYMILRSTQRSVYIRSRMQAARRKTWYMIIGLTDTYVMLLASYVLHLMSKRVLKLYVRFAIIFIIFFTVNYVHWKFISKILKATTNEMREIYDSWEENKEINRYDRTFIWF